MAECAIVRTWFAVADPGGVTGPVAALARAGVTTYPSADLTVRGPVLLFFDGQTDDLGELVGTLSRNGQERLLAVRLGEHAGGSAADFRLLQRGASDVINWRGPETAVLAASRVQRWETIDRIVDSSVVCNNLVGTSPPWRKALRQLVEAAHFSTSSVLITGDTGTGKELAAKLIHTLDPRPEKGELVVLDCATVVESLSGSEFFGHERGAFTGAASARDGVFAVADGGTLFLDEIGELAPPLQAQLLRALQEGAYKPVGSNHWRRTNFRLICATNRDLERELDSGGFRRDLYHRVACWRVRLPGLNERRSDIVPLFNHFAGSCGRPTPSLDPVVAEYLQCRDYPGNVRELRRLAEQACHRQGDSGPITVGCLPSEERLALEWWEGGFLSAVQKAVTLELGLKGIRKAVDEAAVTYALELCLGSVPQAAQKLNMTPRALQLRLAGRHRGGAQDPGVEAAPTEEPCAPPSSSP